MKWGMLTPNTNDLVINGRLEELVEKPFFRGLLEKKRCVLTFNGYYEWKVEGSAKKPFIFLPEGNRKNGSRVEESKLAAAAENDVDQTGEDGIPPFFRAACLYNHPFGKGRPKRAEEESKAI